MNFRNILWTYAPKQNGTCDIKVYFSHLGKKKYLSTGLKVSPKDWDERKEQVRNSHPLASRYNAKVTRLRLDVERHFLEGGTWGNLFEKKQQNNLITFLEKIISEIENGQIPLATGTLKCYKSSLTRLSDFREATGIETTLESMDMAFYQAFVNFLSDDKNCNLPGVNKHVKILKRLMNIGIERGLHKNTVHQQKGFKRYQQVVNPKIYLTEAEIKVLEDTDLSKRQHFQKELDRWLVAYYFLLRFSDLVLISKENIHCIDNSYFFKYRSVKTDNEATIPIRQRAMNLMEQYNFDFSWSTNQQANRQVKIAIAAAGINNMIDQGGILSPKSSFVTMHTARRSAATNLYLSGEFSIKTIADLGGWENIKTLQLYLRCSNMDSARLAAKSDYFR